MKRKSRRKRRQNRRIIIFLIAAVIVSGSITIGIALHGIVSESKENAAKSPEELLAEYMDHIPKQEYEEMYAMIDIEASNYISQEDFIKRNSAIYEGIEVQNMIVDSVVYDDEQNKVTYQTSFDTIAGNISFENSALFVKGEECESPAFII